MKEENLKKQPCILYTIVPNIGNLFFTFFFPFFGDFFSLKREYATKFYY